MIGDRGELRDRFDLMAIETTAGPYVERGLDLMLAKYRSRHRADFVSRTIRELGHTDDLLDDPGLPISRSEIVSFRVARSASIRWR